MVWAGVSQGNLRRGYSECGLKSRNGTLIPFRALLVNARAYLHVPETASNESSATQNS
jgi:hypothetical protein